MMPTAVTGFDSHPHSTAAHHVACQLRMLWILASVLVYELVFDSAPNGVSDLAINR